MAPSRRIEKSKSDSWITWWPDQTLFKLECCIYRQLIFKFLLCIVTGTQIFLEHPKWKWKRVILLMSIGNLINFPLTPSYRHHCALTSKSSALNRHCVNKRASASLRARAREMLNVLAHTQGWANILIPLIFHGNPLTIREPFVSLCAFCRRVENVCGNPCILQKSEKSINSPSDKKSKTFGRSCWA